MAYTQQDYERERAICDKAAAYWQANATFTRGGYSSMSQELCAHPDYAACTNEMRGRVEQWELLRDLPEKFGAYLSSDSRHITTWTGDVLGSAWILSSRPNRGFVSSRYYYGRANIGGKLYSWQGNGEGMLCRLRALKAAA